VSETDDACAVICLSLYCNDFIHAGLETCYKIKKWDFLLKVEEKFRFIQLDDINDAILCFYDMEMFIIIVS
jgi:hypothetical protein